METLSSKLDRTFSSETMRETPHAKSSLYHGPEQAIISECLASFGYTTAKLSAERGKIVELSAAIQAHESASGAAQQATSEQNKAMDALDYWMGAFVRVAKVALRDEPQLLEKLGILKRNSKTPAQRASAGKAAATRKANKEAAPPKA